MDFSKLRNTDSADVPYFSVPDGGIITDARQQVDYKKYQEKYKAFRGVMPELDMINNPPVGVPRDDVYWPEDAKKKSLGSLGKASWEFVKGSAKVGAGLMGAGTGTSGVADLISGTMRAINSDPALTAEMSHSFQKIVDRYRYVYALAWIGYGSGMSASSSVEAIENGLGCSYDAGTGVYREGTWQNGNLVFGLLAADGDVYYGDFRNGMPSEGVLISNNNILCGVFNDDGELECQEGFRIDLEAKAMFVGSFVYNQPHGLCIGFDMSSGQMQKTEYDMGSAKKGLSGMLAKNKAAKDTRKKEAERKKEARKEFFGKFMK